MDKLYTIQGCTHMKASSKASVAFAPEDDTVLLVQNKKKVHFYHIVYDEDNDEVHARHFKSLKTIQSLDG